METGGRVLSVPPFTRHTHTPHTLPALYATDCTTCIAAQLWTR
mgnify:CR=1 FL=1